MARAWASAIVDPGLDPELAGASAETARIVRAGTRSKPRQDQPDGLAIKLIGHAMAMRRSRIVLH
jgi:hypothetical protein